MSGLPLEAGRWAIIDHFSSGSSRILAADGIAAGGISAKRNLGFRGSKLIMPSLEVALAANQDYLGHESLGGISGQSPSTFSERQRQIPPLARWRILAIPVPYRRPSHL